MAVSLTYQRDGNEAEPEKTNDMKYTVKVNTEARRFFEAQWETVGTVTASNKPDAIKKVYDAVWGVENEATVIADGQVLQYVTRDASFKAEREI